MRDIGCLLSVTAVKRVVIANDVPYTTYRLRLEVQEQREEPHPWLKYIKWQRDDEQKDGKLRQGNR